MKGRVASIQVSRAGGVPKREVAGARLTTLGFEGDAVAHPRVHGGPDRAVCLYSLERIHALQAEGHPIAPGSTGENLTLEGIDFDALHIGDVLDIGQARIQITNHTTPCNTIVKSFHDGDVTRILHETYPGWSRLYARVLREGNVAKGDDIERILHHETSTTPPE